MEIVKRVKLLLRNYSLAGKSLLNFWRENKMQIFYTPVSILLILESNCMIK